MRAPGAATLCCYVLPLAWLSTYSILGGQRPGRGCARRAAPPLAALLLSACPTSWLTFKRSPSQQAYYTDVDVYVPTSTCTYADVVAAACARGDYYARFARPR
jgi:hypothetical protein